MKRTLISLLLAAHAVIGVMGQAADSFEAVKEHLLNSSAGDFHKFQPPFPAKFRNVRIGHVGEDKKTASYRMCGEFLPSEGGGKAGWIGFVTIKTDPYEQFLGSGTTYCTDPKMVWDTTEDLAATLKARLDALGKEKKP